MNRILLVVLPLLGTALAAQQPARSVPEDHRPPLFFRETWKDPEIQERKVVQADLVNPALRLRLYGPSTIDVRIVKHASPKDDPSYIWSGSSPQAWALTLKDANRYVDLSGPVAKIRWRTKQAGFNLLRPIVKLADGRFLVGDYTEGYTGDWRETEFPLASVRWRALDSANVVTARLEPGWAANVDLSKVDEVGFTDLMRGSGGGPGGGSRIDWIEVYGHAIPRLTAAAGQQPARPRTILDGVFTQAQAERGLAAYTEHCARCHRDNLRGNPEALGLTGTRFIDAWREDSLFSLFDHMATRMPREPRTTLPAPVYVDILAFVLHFNGYPAGGQELTVDQLKAVRFVDKVGPQPLPNLALVRVVGCLTPGEKGAWTLSAATDPVRDNAGRTTTPDELRASGAAPLGTGNFELQNLDFLPGGFKPEAYGGQKVQVKGALVRRQVDERINVTSLEPVADSCG